jgi:hypothetical protein
LARRICRRSVASGRSSANARVEQVHQRVEQLELRGGLRAEELHVLEHEQVAALAEAALEELHALAADRGHELAREGLGRGVDRALAPAAARFGDDRAREMCVAAPRLRHQ